MPHIRVVTWNSGGEADGRGAALDAAATAINAVVAAHPAPQDQPIHAIAIQEANQGTGGLISNYIQGQIAGAMGLFSNFVKYNISEHHALQTHKVGVSRGYIVCLRTGGPSPVIAVAPAANMIGANSGAGPLYRVDLWADVGALAALTPYTALTLSHLREALKHGRWPVFCCMTVGGVNVVFVTVHLEMKANWLGASVLPPPWAQGLKECFRLFIQPSAWYANAIAWMGPNGLMIIAGDLNGSPAELGQLGILPNFDGTSDNLSHILAYSPNGAVAVTNDWAENPNFPPHHILTAAIDW